MKYLVLIMVFLSGCDSSENEVYAAYPELEFFNRVRGLNSPWLATKWKPCRKWSGAWACKNMKCKFRTWNLCWRTRRVSTADKRRIETHRLQSLDYRVGIA